MGKRIGYLDAAKGIAMLIIIWGHVSDHADMISVWGSSFKLSIFFIISGFLVCRSRKAVPEKKAVFKKLFKSLMVPYLIFSLIWIIIHVSKNLILYGTLAVEDNIDNIYAVLTLRGISTLWFLSSMFIGRLIFEFSGSYRLKVWKQCAVCIVLTAILIILSIAFGMFKKTMSIWITYPFLTFVKGITAYVFFLSGWIIGKSEQKIGSGKLTKFLCIFGFILNIILSMFNRRVDMNYFSFGVHPLLFFVCGLLGSVGLIVLLQALYSVSRIRLTEMIGRNSLFFMLTHPFMLKAAKIASGMFIHETKLTGMYYLRCFIAVVIIIIAEMVILYFRNRIISFVKNKKNRSVNSGEKIK